METLPRRQYLQKLIAKKDNGRVKIITGLRRSGKSESDAEGGRVFWMSLGRSAADRRRSGCDSWQCRSHWQRCRTRPFSPECRRGSSNVSRRAFAHAHRVDAHHHRAAERHDASHEIRRPNFADAGRSNVGAHRTESRRTTIQYRGHGSHVRVDRPAEYRQYRSSDSSQRRTSYRRNAPAARRSRHQTRRGR